MRQLIAKEYSDVKVMTIATPRSGDQSFSADTGMAETLIVGRKSMIGLNGRGEFVSLNRRPRNEMESLEIAKAISGIAASANARNIEDGPLGGYPLDVGQERIGEVIVAPLDSDLPWVRRGYYRFFCVSIGLPTQARVPVVAADAEKISDWYPGQFGRQHLSYWSN